MARCGTVERQSFSGCILFGLWRNRSFETLAIFTNLKQWIMSSRTSNHRCNIPLFALLLMQQPTLSAPWPPGDEFAELIMLRTSTCILISSMIFIDWAWQILQHHDDSILACSSWSDYEHSVFAHFVKGVQYLCRCFRCNVYHVLRRGNLSSM